MATRIAWAAISCLRYIGNSQDLRLRNVAYSSTLLFIVQQSFGTGENKSDEPMLATGNLL